MEGERQKNWAREVAENAKKAIEEMQEAALLSGAATSSQTPSEGLNYKTALEQVRIISEQIRIRMEEPYRKLLRKSGFDEDKDIIIISSLWADAEGFGEDRVPPSLRSRVQFSPHITAPIMLVKVPTEKQHA